MKIIIVDVETTGLLKPKLVPLEKQPKIIEFGALVTDGVKVKKKINQLINPQEPLEPIITKITGITDDDLTDAPTFKQFLPKLLKFWGRPKMVIAHNAPFDTGMMKNELARLNCEKFYWPKDIICTVQEYKTLIGKWPKLEELYANIMEQEPNQTHRALEDVEMLHEILIKDKFYERIMS
jgi:DNA polymerase III epsilon subunit family exonuclease